MRRLTLLCVLLAACGDNRQRSTDAATDVAVDSRELACASACSSTQRCEYVSCSLPTAYSCVDIVDTGACPALAADTDGDGLLDEWELAGFIDVNCNGRNDGDGIDVQLPDAHVDVPDVYLELDYMQQAGSGITCSDDAVCQAAAPGEQCVSNVCTHTHAPKMSALLAVQAAAAHGFYLHYDLVHEDAVAETPVTSFDVSNPACAGPEPSDFFALKTAHFFSGPDGPTSAFAAERRRVYHYAIFAHYAWCPPDASGLGTFCNACVDDRGHGQPQPGMTGTAETPGNDLIVSLGGLYFGYPSSAPRPRTDISEGGTFLHELGHNLGLGHGVTQTGTRAPSVTGPLWSPIYFSVMNYNYQTRGVLAATAPGGGVPATSQIAFSDVDTCADLNEAALDESVGAACAASTNLVVAYFADAGGPQKFASAQTGIAIDWNGNATIGVEPDNLDRNVDANTTDIFRSMNDWTALQYDTTCHRWTLEDGVAPAAALSTNELTSPLIIRRGL